MASALPTNAQSPVLKQLEEAFFSDLSIGEALEAKHTLIQGCYTAGRFCYKITFEAPDYYVVHFTKNFAFASIEQHKFGRKRGIKALTAYLSNRSVSKSSPNYKLAIQTFFTSYMNKHQSSAEGKQVLLPSPATRCPNNRRCWAQFILQRGLVRLKERMLTASTTDLGFKILKHTNPKTNEKCNYYFETLNYKWTGYWTNDGANLVTTVRGGQFKNLTHIGPKKVTLVSKSGNFPSSLIENNNNLTKKVMKYKTLCTGIFVSKRKLVCRYGGLDVFDEYTSQGYTLKLGQFEMLCRDVSQALLQNIMIPDIKLENLTVTSVDGCVKLVDVDEIVTPDKSGKKICTANSSYTLAYTALDLYQATHVDVYRQQVNYAMLLTIMATTDMKITWILQTHDGRSKGGIYLVANNLFDHWISSNVKDSYKKKVVSFLINPKVYPLHDSLCEMLTWNAVPDPNDTGVHLKTC
ncbi:MAG: hypothetical protein HAW66_02825 [Shewanella sp.]|nr:hypothetical protein [Shewanella sp.]